MKKKTTRSALSQSLQNSVPVRVMIDFDDWDHSCFKRKRFILSSLHWTMQRWFLIEKSEEKRRLTMASAVGGFRESAGVPENWSAKPISWQEERCFKILKNSKQDGDEREQTKREAGRGTFIIDVSTNWISSKGEEEEGGEDQGKGEFWWRCEKSSNCQIPILSLESSEAT